MLLCAKTELFSTTRDQIRKFEIPEGFPVFEDLNGHVVLKGDVGDVGRVLSPHMVGFIKPGKFKGKVEKEMIVITRHGMKEGS